PSHNFLRVHWPEVFLYAPIGNRFPGRSARRQLRSGGRVSLKVYARDEADPARDARGELVRGAGGKIKIARVGPDASARVVGLGPETCGQGQVARRGIGVTARNGGS